MVGVCYDLYSLVCNRLLALWGDKPGSDFDRDFSGFRFLYDETLESCEGTNTVEWIGT